MWKPIWKLTVGSILKPKPRWQFRVLIVALVTAGSAVEVRGQPPARPTAPIETENNDGQIKSESNPATRSEAIESGPSPEAAEVARIFGFPITNSMIVTWIVALGLVVSAQIATQKIELVPTGLQNFWEWLVEGLQSFLEQIIGRHLVERTFWLFATIFIFILAANWAGLIPGVGTIGWGHQTGAGFKVDTPLFRGATADLNLTLAIVTRLLRVMVLLGREGSWSGRAVSRVVYRPKGRHVTSVDPAAEHQSSLPRAALKSFPFCCVPLRCASDFMATSLPVTRCLRPWRTWCRASAGWCRFRFTSWSS